MPAATSRRRTPRRTGSHRPRLPDPLVVAQGAHDVESLEHIDQRQQIRRVGAPSKLAPRMATLAIAAHAEWDELERHRFPAPRDDRDAELPLRAAVPQGDPSRDHIASVRLNGQQHT